MTAAAPSRHTNVSAELRSFVGRAAELDRLASRVRDGDSLITLRGPAGVGKTRLARELVLLLAPEQEGGAWFCDLVEARTVPDLLGRVASSLELSVGGGEEDAQAARLAASLAGRGRLLLVLDNFEQLTQHRLLLSSWLEAAPELCLLVTSREILSLQQETVVELSPLPPAEAVALFVDRASGGQDTEPDPELASIVLQIVEQLDRFPLSIELAAGRADLLGPRQLLERLSQRFEILRSGRADLPEKSATLLGTLDWSWELLSPVEQSVLAQCSVFRGGFFAEAAEEVVRLSASAGELTCLEVLSALLAKSLLTAKSVDGRQRLGMYKTVRRYAARQLRSAEFSSLPQSRGEGLDLHLVAGDPHLTLSSVTVDLAGRRVLRGDQAEPLTGKEAQLLAYLAARPDTTVSRAELLREIWGYSEFAVSRAVDTMVRGLRKKVEDDPARPRHVLSEYGVGYSFHPLEEVTGDAAGSELVGPEAVLDRLAQWCAGLGEVEFLDSLDRRGGQGRRELLGLEAENLQEGLEAALLRGSPQITGQICLALLVHAQDWGPYLGAAMVGSRVLGSVELPPALRARLLLAQGWLWHRAGSEAATACLEEALVLARQASDLRLEARLRANLGVFLPSVERGHEAEEHQRAALAVHRELGDRLQEGVTLTWLGNRAMVQGRCQEALEHFGEALSVHREVGNRRFEGTTLTNRGTVHRIQGRLALAEEDSRAALEIQREIRNQRAESFVLVNLASLLGYMGQAPEALELCSAALTVSRRLGHRWGEAYATQVAGAVRLLSGDLTQAGPLLEQSQAAFRELNARGNEGLVLALRGDLALACGDLKGARNLLTEAAEVLGEARRENHRNLALGWLAEAEGRLGRGPEAQVLFEQARAGLEETGRAFELADLACRQAAVAVATDDRQQARARLDAAEALARPLGMAPAWPLAGRIARLRSEVDR